MNNKFNRLQKNSAMLLATILVAGIIGISFPIAVFAQGYDGYKSEMRDGKSDSVKQISDCRLFNSNSNSLTQEQTQVMIINGQELTPEEISNVLNGNGEPLVDITGNIVERCFSTNFNEIIAIP